MAKQSSDRAIRRAKRLAEQRAKEDAWQAKVAAHFSYLETIYGFHITQVDASSVWQIRLIYQNATTAIYVDRSVEFSRVELKLIRLVDGVIPDLVIFVTANVTLHEFLFDNLLQIRAPDALAKLRTLGGLEEAQIESSLTFLAHALKDYAADILQGDFSNFAALEELVKQRARENPPQITVMVPSDTSKECQQQIVEELQKKTPDVPVVMKVYQHPVPKRKRSAKGTKASSPESD